MMMAISITSTIRAIAQPWIFGVFALFGVLDFVNCIWVSHPFILGVCFEVGFLVCSMVVFLVCFKLILVGTTDFAHTLSVSQYSPGTAHWSPLFSHLSPTQLFRQTFPCVRLQQYSKVAQSELALHRGQSWDWMHFLFIQHSPSPPQSPSVKQYRPSQLYGWHILSLSREFLQQTIRKCLKSL